MMLFPVVVRWNGQRLAVDLDTAESPLVFKLQLYSLTGVEPDRQKIMVKGGLLKDDADWNTLGIKPGHAFMMMGTPGPLVVPTAATTLTESKQQTLITAPAANTVILPPGLMNLGCVDVWI